MDCVQALDHLHLTATHAMSRPAPLTADGTAGQGGESLASNAGDLSLLPADLVRAIWQVWFDHLRLRAGDPPAS
jgi:hypothetical protein